MNRALWIVLGPTAIVAVGYILVLRAIGLQPPYTKLAAVVAALALVLWWIWKKRRASSPEK